MNMQNQWKRLAIGGVAALTLTAGTFWAVDNVSAASSTTGWMSTLSQQVQQFAGRGGRGGHHGPDGLGGRGGAFLGDQQQYLADALGITVDGLTAAQSAARDAALTDALADGSITQEQFDGFKAQQALQEYLRTTYADARPEGTKAELIQEALAAEAITQAQAELLSTSPMLMGPDGGKGMRGPGRGDMGRGDMGRGDMGRGEGHGKMGHDEMGRGGPAGFLPGDQQQYLADALGITAEQLQAAQDTVRNGIIDQAVTDGTITQEQADQLKAGERVPGLRMPGGPEMDSVDREALLAGALGITVDELDAAQTAAHDAAIAAAVADGTITQEQADRMGAQQAFQAYLRATYPDARPQETMAVLIQNAVDGGAITQAQADLLLSGGGRMGPGGMDGFRGPRDGGMRGPGMRGPDMRSPGAQDDTTQPDTQPNSSDDSQGESTNSNT